jgi:hypothetical protein
MHSPKHLIGHRPTFAAPSLHKTIGALVCAAVIGLTVVGVAAASPVAPTPPVITAPTPPTPPTVIPPTPPTGASTSGDASAIQQDVSQLLAAGGTQGGQLPNPLCDYPQPSQVFAPWGDNSYYALAPDGDFATSGAWSLNAEAAVVSGADPYSGAQQSLQLTTSGQAASPVMCVNVNDPTIRFFVRDLSGNGNADLRVDVLYQGRNGNVQSLTLARVSAGSSWQPSPSVAIRVNRLAAASSSGDTAVAFVFTAEGLAQNETIGVSSLYVDPFQSV